MQSFYLSKMTLVDELEQANQEYTFIKWPEFIEFVGRLAYFKFQKTPQAFMSLKQKLITVLDSLLALVNERR